MIIKEFRDYSNSRKGKRMLSLLCDSCGREFVRKFKNSQSNRPDHYCSLKCMQTSKITVEKRRHTSFRNYGVDNPAKSSVVKQKIKNTNIKRYGNACSLHGEQIKEKVKKTNLERYGYENAAKSDYIKTKSIETNLRNHGVRYTRNIPGVIEKAKQTNLERYGYECPMTQPHIKAKANTPSAINKCHQTKKKNDSYGKSKIEDEFYEYLLTVFPCTIVSRQQMINGWNIDFKIGETYVQFDGVYYHGLDRHINIIKEFNTKTDKVIYKTYLRDLEQNSWFKENGLKLIRVTDKDFMQKDFSISTIINK